MDNTQSQYVHLFLEYYTAVPWLVLLVGMMLIDIVSGFVAGIIQKRLSTKVSFKGMMKKAAIMLVIGMSVLIEQAIRQGLPLNYVDIPLPLVKLIAGFFFLNECLSVLENARNSGVPLPAFLSKSLVDTIARISNGEVIFEKLPKIDSKTYKVHVKDATIEAEMDTKQQDKKDGS